MNADAEMYLGDAVYARFDGFSVWLTTRDGMGTCDVTNVICLEPEVWRTLFEFLKHQGWKP